MHNDLVTLAARPRIELMAERGFGDQAEDIGVLLGHARGIVRSVGDVSRRTPRIQLLSTGGQRLQEYCSHFRLEAPVDDEHAVVVLVDVEGSAGVPLLGFSRLGESIDPPPSPHDALHVKCGAGPTNDEQTSFRLPRCNTGESPDLGVGELPSCESLGQEREIRQGSGNAHVLPGGAQVEADPPGEPMGTGPKPGVPPLPGVEFTDEREEPRRGRVEMGGQFGDLITEAFELGDIGVSRNQGRQLIAHRGSSFTDSIPVIWYSGAAAWISERRVENDSWWKPGASRVPGSGLRAWSHAFGDRERATGGVAKPVKRKV